MASPVNDVFDVFECVGNEELLPPMLSDSGHSPANKCFQLLPDKTSLIANKLTMAKTSKSVRNNIEDETLGVTDDEIEKHGKYAEEFNRRLGVSKQSCSVFT